MLVVGLTGPIGAGKSTLAQAMRERGIPVIDTDVLSREVAAPGTPCLRALADAFSSAILRPDGSLDRAALAQRAFTTPEAARRLSDITHPAIIARSRERLAEYRAAGAPVVLVEAPLLFESGMDAVCDKTVAVVAPPEVRRDRVQRRDGLSPDQIGQRMAAQQPDEYYRARAGLVLENGGSRWQDNAEELYKTMQKWLQSPHKKKRRFPILLAVLLICGFLTVKWGYREAQYLLYPRTYLPLIEQHAALNRLDPSLVLAVIRTESRFRSDAVSAADARGLMQITMPTFEWAQYRSAEKESLEKEALFDPEINIKYGTYILWLLAQEFSDPDTVLAAYNAGIGSVRKWLADPRYSDDGVTLKKIEYPETENYVKQVRLAQKRYQELYYQ